MRTEEATPLVVKGLGKRSGRHRGPSGPRPGKARPSWMEGPDECWLKMFGCNHKAEYQLVGVSKCAGAAVRYSCGAHVGVYLRAYAEGRQIWEPRPVDPAWVRELRGENNSRDAGEAARTQ